MKIGLIDVDGHNYPNLALMKISAWHKAQGDSVEWYEPLAGHYDKVYVAKVFSFSQDYEYYIDADIVEYGGTGYCMSVVDGKEVFDVAKHKNLPHEIEHSFPDYSIYYDKVPETKDTAYGYLTRGCPRGCDFCIVEKKEGRCSIKQANLDEFWNGQKHIELLDPNMFACKDWRELAGQLIDSKAWINFNQGVDIRIMTDEMAQAITKMKIKFIHFAWDRYEQKELVVPKLKMFRDVTGYDRHKVQVYVLVNSNTTLEQDLERIYTIRDIGFFPYVMVYQKETAPKVIKKLQRYVNNKWIFRTNNTFEDYLKGK